METFKVIFSGKLEFGNARSFEKVVKMYDHRMENYYKSEILLKSEDVFCDATNSLNVPRFIAKSTNKWWKNTVNLLDYVGQYAISGDLSMWMVESGQILKHKLVEPVGDKMAIQAFLKGRQLVDEKGKEEEAKVALSSAIEKFARHGKAYERRGFVNFKLGNFKDAIYDYTKSIDINPNNAEAYLGRATVRKQLGACDDAVADYGLAIKKSIPLQPIYWDSRYFKALCHVEMNDHEGVVSELKFYTKRAFADGSTNFARKRRAWFEYGKALMQLGDFKTSAEAFESAITLQDTFQDTSDAELLLYTGIALQESGQLGYEEKFKEAANKGSVKAAELLAEVVAA